MGLVKICLKTLAVASNEIYKCTWVQFIAGGAGSPLFKNNLYIHKYRITWVIIYYTQREKE